MKFEEAKKGMKGMERIGQYCPEESIVRMVIKHCICVCHVCVV